MAIQMRRGAWSQFDPTKMLPGEWAVILSGHPDTSNGQALYHCFAAGSVKQIATIEDAATIIANATEDIREELTQDIASALAQVGAATNAANTATANANTATSAANAATQAATSASERAEAAIDAMGDISEQAVPLMSADTRGGAKLEAHGGLALRDGALGIGSLVQESDGYARGGLAEVTAKGHAEQDGTPTPDNPVPIQVVRGRNLLDTTAVTSGKYLASDGTETSDAAYSISDYVPVEVGVTYVTSGMGAVSSAYYAWYNASKTYISATKQKSKGFTLTAPANAAYVRVSLLNASLGTSQLEVGSTPQPYVPYGHVGLEVRDPDTNELISCTPIPLPSRGWVAGLPDGTADSLRLDGAGKCEWTLPTADIVVDGNAKTVSWLNNFAYTALPNVPSGIPADFVSKLICSHFRSSVDSNSGSCRKSGDNILFQSGDTWNVSNAASANSWFQTNPTTVLYPLATPVTEDCGYVEDWPTDLPEGAVIDIPELSEVGIKYFIDSSVTELAKQWYERANSEYEDRLQALEEAMATIITGS